MIRFILMVAALATPVTAELSDSEKLDIACDGWRVDRGMLSVVAMKNREMIDALNDIDSANPSKPVARAVADSVTTINNAIRDGLKGTTPALDHVCSRK